MARLSIADLPFPDDEFRIDLDPARPLDRNGNPQQQFETLEFSTNEDRAERGEPLLAATSASSYGLFRARSAHKLGRKLLRRRRPRTLASSRYLREVRIRLSAAAQKLLLDCRWHPLETSTFAVIPRTWEFEPANFDDADARKLLDAFRADLNRCGAKKADGFLICFLHGEFEPEAGIYVLHVHGIVAGGMIGVLDALRRTKNYRCNTQGHLTGSSRVKTRIQISRKLLTDLPYTLIYPLKTYWPSKRIGPVGENKVIKRQRQHHRIAEPYHSQVLLWLDQWSLPDITLLMKVRVGPEGFVISSVQGGNQAAT
jgi:hypothetical protein